MSYRITKRRLAPCYEFSFYCPECDHDWQAEGPLGGDLDPCPKCKRLTDYYAAEQVAP